MQFFRVVTKHFSHMPWLPVETCFLGKMLTLIPGGNDTAVLKQLRRPDDGSDSSPLINVAHLPAHQSITGYVAMSPEHDESDVSGAT